jgi:hypothetical protein
LEVYLSSLSLTPPIGDLVNDLEGLDETGQLCYLVLMVTTLSLLSMLLSSQNATLTDIFHEYKVKDLSHPQIQTEVVDDGGCSPYYYVQLSFPGVFEGKKTLIELDLQTLTPENMTKVSTALEANYAQHGFPECMKTDTYDDVDWVLDNMKNILHIPVSFKGDHGTCYGTDDLLPYTNCIRVDDIYPAP